MIFNSPKKQITPTEPDPNQATDGLNQEIDNMISDVDQDLSKVLADIDNKVAANQELMEELKNQPSTEVIPTTEQPATAKQPVTVEQPVASQPIPENNFQKVDDEADVINAQAPTPVEAPNLPQAEPASIEPAPVDVAVNNSPVATSERLDNMDDLRKRALLDLRPIVDKIGLKDEEAFNVLLLLIRETDDESLLPDAYEAARNIVDESRRAQALLDVIRETEYFKNKAD